MSFRQPLSLSLSFRWPAVGRKRTNARWRRWRKCWSPCRSPCPKPQLCPPFPQPPSPQHHGSAPCSLQYTTATTHRPDHPTTPAYALYICSSIFVLFEVPGRPSYTPSHSTHFLVPTFSTPFINLLRACLGLGWFGGNRRVCDGRERAGENPRFVTFLIQKVVVDSRLWLASDI